MYIDWVVRFLPLLVLVLLLNLFFLFHLPVPVKRLAGTSEYFKEMYAQLGTIRLGEKSAWCCLSRRHCWLLSGRCTPGGCRR